MPVFYHVSQDLHHDGTFSPRIPLHRHDDEDGTIARICVAPTIEGCFTGMPGGGYSLESLNLINDGLYLIFRIDTDRLGITSENILTSEELYQRDLVRDADISDENWILCTFVIPEEDRFIVQIKDWDEEETDLVPSYIYDLAEKKYGGDVCLAYQKHYDTPFVPSTIVVKNLRYLEEHLKPGKRIQYHVNSFHLETIKRYLENELEIPVQENDDNTLSFFVTNNVTLRSVFQYHRQLIDIHG